MKNKYMTKYIIEGNIDFFNELNSLQEDTEENSNNVCLITNELLDENYIELECGHKFNYLPLLKDVLNHKQKYNNLESKKEMLYKNEMRCPYCRYKQHKLLPYMENIFADKINGVNYYDPNLSVCEYCNDNDNKCCYTYTFSDTDNEPIKCNKHGSKIWLSNNYGDNNSYCSYHKKIVIKSHIVKEKQKAKEEAKQQAKEAKLKAKEDAKNAKEEAKLKAKEDAKKAKEEAKLKEKEAKLKAKEDAKKAKEDAKLKVKEDTKKTKEEKIKSKGDDKMV